MILLDTHVLVEADSDDRKLGRKACALIERLWTVAVLAHAQEERQRLTASDGRRLPLLVK